MKKKFLLALSLTLAASITSLVACDVVLGEKPVVDLSDVDCPQFIEKTLVDFTESVGNVFEISDARTNGDPFGVYWNKNNVQVDTENGVMTASISKDEEVYYGAEMKTKGNFGAVQYGYFGCVMKPSKVVGTASTFFTYTGDYEGNPHDEIDIEFLGKDTTKVQFNYFLNDVGGHEYWYDLGFDAGDDFHQYGFYWDEEKIVWYVDYQPVYCVAGETSATPQRVYTNFWAGEPTNQGVMDWMGELNDEDLPAATQYKQITVAYLNGRGLEIPEPEYVPAEEEFTPTSVTINGGATDIYHVTTDSEGVNTITYDSVLPKSYKNVYGDVAEQVKSAQYVSMRIKNNGNDYVKVRVDVQSEKVNLAGIKAINAAAWMNGEQVKTDLVYGGSFFDVQPGEEVFCVIRYYGIPYRLLYMLDSCTRTDKETFAGNVSIFGFGYCGENDYVEQYVNISSNYELLRTGESVLLTAEGTSEVTWSVENPNIATVENGLVTAIAEGVTTVTAKCGDAKAVCTIKVSNSDPKEEETLDIVADEQDLAKLTSVTKTNGVYATEPVNTYGASLEAVAWSQAVQYNLLYLKTGEYKATADGYIEYFIKNVGHTTLNDGETINGVFFQLYDANCSAKVGTEIKLYKKYNSDCATDAGNGWYRWRIPFSLLGVSEGSTFGAFRFKLYANMDANEYFYLDGVKIYAEEVGGSGEGGQGGGEQGEEPSVVDHTAETLAICQEVDDILDEEHKKYVNATYAFDENNHYGNAGNSANALKWTGCIAYENMMFFVNAEKTTVAIQEGAYVELFVKNVGHTSDSTALASGVTLRLYNGSDSTKVDGVQDVKLYRTYNAENRTEAGNGWYYYKLPLTAFGTLGASFDRIRIATNVAFDSAEVMYIDGMRVVYPSEEEGGQGEEPIGVDHTAETLAICAEVDDILDDEHKKYANATVAYDEENYYGASGNSVSAFKWTGAKAYENAMFFVNAEKTPITITADGYIELYIKDVGHTSDSTALASGIILRLYNGSDSTKVDGVQDVKLYKSYNAENRTDAGNGWYYYRIPLSALGTVGATFDRIRFATNVDFDADEVMYIDGMRVVLGQTEE